MGTLNLPYRLRHALQGLWDAQWAPSAAALLARSNSAALKALQRSMRLGDTRYETESWQEWTQQPNKNSME
ncbi:hypothetical protein CMUS01_02784 [Colletotrichum musicola]|uniref:Uncharacterized protein n=1 Tax=Colletotrichum musicola TaxID=2175873 RepID=A0A8H6NUC5_9PEZI|nr:hypothetical protein CMUS01_02784 [Colletotrichum musicola]